ncbi:hypothetical protein SAMN05192544_102824 [Paraburkholderia hospita]|nr:hypothetical protein SAMN05192544_102824 [Paraburkholderia hospita]
MAPPMPANCRGGLRSGVPGRTAAGHERTLQQQLAAMWEADTDEARRDRAKPGVLGRDMVSPIVGPGN